jgi:hypothetical protein
MLREYHRMRLLGVVSLFSLLVASACGVKRNAHRCADGICVDEHYPFCDLDGTLGGEPKECIAVSCTPNEFEACRGDDELRCNASGTNYDQTRCELGCSESTGGCKLCEANETRCTNGKVATCDANGAVASMVDCPLGCFEDQPRCRNVNPSNDLAPYLDMYPTLPDVDLDNVTINTASGVVTNNVTNQPIQGLVTFMAYGPTTSIRVFVANHVRLNNVGAFSGTSNVDASGPALAFVARGPIVVEGTLALPGSAGGIKNDPTCRGGIGSFNSALSTPYARASGGGGNATPGGAGGSNNGSPGAIGGQVSGNETLEPLRGGCPSGGTRDEYYIDDVNEVGYPGGGAVQLTSEISVDVLGKIDVRGMHGDYEAGPMFTAVFGGGAGGGVLIEAPRVSFGATAKIIAKGGGGGAYGGGYPADDDTLMPSTGAVVGSSCPTCGNGGAGASPLAGAVAGGPAPVNSVSGGGGGGMGRLRVNTKDGTYTKSSSAIEAAITTTGIVKTH